MKNYLCNMKRVMLAMAMILLTMITVFAGRADCFAASANAKMTGPSVARVGDTVTFVLKINGTGLQGAEATLEYNDSQLEFKSMTKKIADPWMAELSGSRLVAYDNELSAPIKGEKELVAVSFKVKNLSVGTKITVSFKDIIVSDGTQDISAGRASSSFTVAPPLSGDNSLALLTVGNGTLSPAFSAGTYKYEVTVPYDVTRMNVKASAAHGNAKVEIDEPELIPEKNVDVTIKVTAENGAVKTYTISVYREKDPNYVPSGNCALAGIVATGYRLSPLFDGELTEYVIWVPYETENVEIMAWAEHEKAFASVKMPESLAVGDNEVKIKCTAENGEEKFYTVIVKRAVAHQDLNATPQPTETHVPTSTPEPLPTDSVDCTCSPSANTDGASNQGGSVTAEMIICGTICGVVAAAVSALITVLVLKKKKQR